MHLKQAGKSIRFNTKSIQQTYPFIAAKKDNGRFSFKAPALVITVFSEVSPSGTDLPLDEVHPY